MTNKLLIKNIGTIVSGHIDHPILNADTICATDDTISYIGPESQAPNDEYTTVIDANGLIVLPGPIDAHTHPPLANYLANFKAYDWVDNYAAAGITGMISVGGLRFPGVATTRNGIKAQAIMSKELWDNYHPSGVKIHGGTLMLVPGLTEDDLAEMQQAGIKILGEIGMSAVKDPDEAAEYVKLAKKHGFRTTIHTGGPSSKDCASYSFDDIMKIDADVLCHLNGVPTPMDDQDVEALIKSGQYYFDTTSNGNMRMLINIANWAKDSGQLDKAMLGSNVPSMAGFSPMGLWIQMAIISSSTDVEPEEAIAMATGNVCKCYGLDHGIIEKGYKADIIFGETGSVMPDILSTLKFGRVPIVAGTVVNGKLTLARCKNMAPPARTPIVKTLKEIS